jgi:glutathione S-transferase
MKLYYAPRTHATRARWLLEELEVPYDLVRLDLSKQENRNPDFLAISPLGELPALVDGDVILLEPAAIALYLVDRFPERQLAPPASATARAAYYQWLVFAESTLAPVVTKLYELAQLSDDAASAAHRARLATLLDVVTTAVERSDFLAAGHFTAADLSMASILHLANHLKLPEGRPRLVEYVYLHCKRPASRRAVS